MPPKDFQVWLPLPIFNFSSAHFPKKVREKTGRVLLVQTPPEPRHRLVSSGNLLFFGCGALHHPKTLSPSLSLSIYLSLSLSLCLPLSLSLCLFVSLFLFLSLSLSLFFSLSLSLSLSLFLSLSLSLSLFVSLSLFLSLSLSLSLFLSLSLSLSLFVSLSLSLSLFCLSLSLSFSLSLFLSLSLSLSFLSLSLSLFLSLSLSLSFCLSLSLSLSLFPRLSCLGVPRCFCHSWEPFLYWCVLGRWSRCWEHLRFFLSLLLFSSFLFNWFLNEVWSVIGLSPFMWSPLHWPPQTFFLIFFHVLLSSCLVILSLLFSCAHFRPGPSLYPYSHAYAILNFKLGSGAPGLLQ